MPVARAVTARSRSPHALRSQEGRAERAEADWIGEASREIESLSDRPVRVAFLKRALGEVIALARQDDAALLEALATPGQVVPLLKGKEEPPSARWGRARDAGRRALLALLDAEGGVLTPDQVAERLGRTRQAVHQRQKKGQLLAVPGVRGAVYPAWQFEGNEVLPGMAEALDALDDTPPAMAVQFFLTGRDSLGGERPLDLLRAGRRADVVRAAAEFAAG